jgi:predicted dehydrogenase
MIAAAAQSGKKDDINIGLIGAGIQGRRLLYAIMKIPGVRVKAVCDIWKDYNLKIASGQLKAFKHENRAYVDHKEMLDKEKDLDAVIVATPDFWHGRHTIDSLNKGLHVYCEKEMSNSLEEAKKMVVTAREKGKLLQIGHQRRSNPRYKHCKDNIDLLGRITTINGQWNRGIAASGMRKLGKVKPIDAKVLEQYGFGTMEKFLNWREFKGFGTGLVGDLGSHQIDIYSWFLGAAPKSVMASGGVDYWDYRQWYDRAHMILEYEYEYEKGKKQKVAATYQVITTNSNKGYYEKFMGADGALLISEKDNLAIFLWEPGSDLDKWDAAMKNKYIESKKTGGTEVHAETNPSPTTEYPYNIIAPDLKLVHQPHLENFFNAIRGTEKLNCPGEVGYETCAIVFKTNEAIEAGKRLSFSEADFKV